MNWMAPWMQKGKVEEEEPTYQGRRAMSMEDVCTRVGLPNQSWDDICKMYMPPRLAPLADALKRRDEEQQAAEDAALRGGSAARGSARGSDAEPELSLAEASRQAAALAEEPRKAKAPIDVKARIDATMKAAEAASQGGSALAKRYTQEREKHAKESEARRARLFEIDPEAERERKSAEDAAASKSSMFDFDSIPADTEEATK